MVGLQAGLRKDRFDRFGEALRVIREGRGHLEAVVFSWWQKLPGILAMLRRRVMGHQDAVMLILHHHDTVSSPQRGVAVHRTRRHRDEGQPWPQHLRWRGHRCAHSIDPAFARRLGHGHQAQHGKEQRNMPEADPTDTAREPAHRITLWLIGWEVETPLISGGKDTRGFRSFR